MEGSRNVEYAPNAPLSSVVDDNIRDVQSFRNGNIPNVGNLPGGLPRSADLTGGPLSGQPGAGQNIAAGHPDPTVRQLGELMAQKGKDGYGNVNITIGDVASKNSVGGGGPGGIASGPTLSQGPQSAERGDKGALIEKYHGLRERADAAWAAFKADRNNDAKMNAYEGLREEMKSVANQIFYDLDRRILADRAAGINATPMMPGTAQEHRNALSAVSGRTKAEAARMIAEKTGGDPNKARRWMSMFVRWPAAVFSSIFSGAAGFTAQSFGAIPLGTGLTAAGTYLGVPTAWLSAGALGSIPTTVGGFAVPLIGGMALPALPVIVAALGGVALWQLVRTRIPLVGRVFKGIDVGMEHGWQAKKLYNKMEADDSQAAIDRKYKKITSLRKKIFRMQQFPRIFGTILGGGIASDVIAGHIPGYSPESVVRKGAVGTYEGGRKLATRGWNNATELWKNPKWPDWLSRGEPIRTGVGADDLEVALANSEGEVRYLTRRIENLYTELEGVQEALEGEVERAKTLAATNDALRTDLAGREAALDAQAETIAEQLARIQALEAEQERLAQQLAEANKRPTINTIPRSESLLQMFPGARGMDASDLIFSITNEPGQVQNIPQGLRRLFTEMGFTGTPAEVLIDAIDKVTYNGYGGVRGGPDVLYDFTGQRTTPTRIRPGDVDITKYLQNRLAMSNLMGVIDNSALSVGQRTQVHNFLELLQRIARR